MSGAGIVVYGANGATGARIAQLAAASGARVIVAGRRPEALAPIARDHEIRIGELTAADLDRVCAGADAIISCVAPYTRHGRPLVEAAVRAGAHYVDCSGEPRYVAGLLDDFDAAARTAGIAIVPAAGIGLCTNLVARVGAERLASVTRMTVDYRVRGMVPSWGTTASTLQILARGSAVARGGRLEFAPAGSRVARLSGGLGARFPLTDVVTLHHQWPEAQIDSYIRSPAAPLLAPMMFGAGWLGRRPRVAAAVDRAARRLQRPGAPAPRGQFDVTVTASGPGTVTEPVVTVGRVADIYELTSRAALAVAQLLVAGRPEPGFRATGEVVGDPRSFAGALDIDLDELDQSQSRR